MSQANQERFRSIVADVLGIPAAQVTDDLKPDLVDSWDSLNHINILGALEQEFAVTFATDDLAGTQSIASLKALLAQHGVEL